MNAYPITMRLFTFEPGDGLSYRVLFGRLPSQSPFIPYYTVFGIAEGSNELGSWYAFDTDRISEETFSRHIAPGLRNNYVYFAAWRLWLALTGAPDDPNVAEVLDEWRADWRRQLPAAALG